MAGGGPDQQLREPGLTDCHRLREPDGHFDHLVGTGEDGGERATLSHAQEFQVTVGPGLLQSSGQRKCKANFDAPIGRRECPEPRQS
ncbi:hypothetical protein FHT17_000034 [Novosphingobium sp. SG916]|nr:hypothetical protein [Novosphingobium sp. SG919]NMN85164.1 hypothetical protein [Novosphingobium sp. SG916]